MLKWFESDGVTPLSSLGFGSIKPGEDYYTKNGAYLQVVVKNTGASTVTGVVAEITAVGTYDLWEFVQMATGATPGAFVDAATDPLALGDLAPNAEAKVWFDLIVPLYAVEGRAQYGNVRAYGSGS